MRYFVQLKEKMRNHLDGEERAGCFAWFVFMVPRYGAGLFLAVPMGCLLFLIVVNPDHTHYFLPVGFLLLWYIVYSFIYC